MGLSHGDLRMTIDETVEIDRYKAKMGTDEDVAVVNFTAENKDAGQDLVDFLESGYDWILDSAVSPGTTPNDFGTSDTTRIGMMHVNTDNGEIWIYS